MRDKTGKDILFTIGTIICPIIFPFWYISHKRLDHRKEKIILAVGSLYSFIWLALACSIVVPTHDSPISSSTSNIVYSKSYEELSYEYENKFYGETKAATIVTSSSQSGQTQPNANQASSESLAEQPNNPKTEQSAPQTDIMSGINIAEDDGSPYLRADYGSGWNIGMGCNIRSRLLTAQSIENVQTSNGCLVIYGKWIDPYSGIVLEGNPYQGDGEENDLDIDHIIPLRYVNSHGGYAWSSSQKIAYGKSLEAMNNGVYLAVSSKENRQKSDKGPADYYPSNPNYYCEYSRKWRDIARSYSISLSKRDYDKVESVLRECNIN